MKFKKSLGQNLLIDKNIIKKIIKIGNLNTKSSVLEIGSGTGNLTNEILKLNPKNFWAVEKDYLMYLKLKFEQKQNKSFKIFNEDALRFKEEKLSTKNITVYGNLPYNISTQLLVKWIMTSKWPPWYNCLILMFQKEVAERIVAKTNTSSYGRLSIMSNLKLKIKKEFDVSKNCFFPKPKINSTILSFTPKSKNVFDIKNPKNLETVTRTLFSNRRKMINKNFLKLFNGNKSIAKNLNLNLTLRPGE